MVIDQINSQNQHNSVFQRLDWLQRGVRALETLASLRSRTAVLVQGHDLAPFQPPQAELEVLASAGWSVCSDSS